MKKLFLIVLLLAMLLSLCACGSESNNASTETAPETTPEITPEPTPLKETVIGTWVYRFKAIQGTPITQVGDDLRQVMEVYKGGTGKYTYYNDTRNECNGNPSFSWEIKDDVLNLTFLHDGTMMAFIYDEATDTLTRVDDNARVYTRES